MQPSYDVIIAGTGAMGSAAADCLSARGLRVLALDRFSPPHTLGSSHGETRVIREAYFEHPSYVPLVQRAYQLWKELESRTGDELLEITGGLMIGPPDGMVFSGAKRSAEEHQLPHEILSRGEVNERFPAFRMPSEFLAVHEPHAGMLFAERCVSAFIRQARNQGADLRFNETVRSWKSDFHDVTVKTDQGVYSGEKLLITTGAWLAGLMPELGLTVERQVLHWFETESLPAAHQPSAFPVNAWEFEPGHFFYALPDAGSGVKVALHHQGETTSPEAVRRSVDPMETESIARLVRQYLPHLKPVPQRSEVCLYTNTPDHHFLIDWHPDYENVLLASPCSGHGFKFASVIGEIAADFLTIGSSSHDTTLFRHRKPRRF